MPKWIAGWPATIKGQGCENKCSVFMEFEKNRSPSCPEMSVQLPGVKTGGGV